MNARDREEFGLMLDSVYEFYGKEPSETSLEIWWTAMQPFDLAAVRRALGQHAVNPDSGQFLPKPADVVKMLGGSTLDSALVAWSKFEGALESVGRHMTVVFDDPLIHRVVEDMGGWVVLGSCPSRDWPFRQNEFVNRYRGFKVRGETPTFPAKLVGMHDGANAANGFAVDGSNVRFIGNKDLALKVLAGGSKVPRLAISTIAAALQAPGAQVEQVKR